MPHIHELIDFTVAIFVVQNRKILLILHRDAKAGRGPEEVRTSEGLQAVETLARVTVLASDKTGTLTEGKPRLVTVEPLSSVDATTLLRLVASLENVSEHPLAAAIVGGARERGVTLSEVRDFESVTGKGVTGIVDGRSVAIGNLRHVEALGLDPGVLRDRAAGLGDARAVCE